MAENAELLHVGAGCDIPLSEIEVTFTTSGGPGGQHVNRSNTRVEVRFDAASSRSLSEDHRRRIVGRLGGVVRVVASDERSQLRNRALALARLQGRLAKALHGDKPRRPTRPTRTSQKRRLEGKRRRGETKRRRSRPEEI